MKRCDFLPRLLSSRRRTAPVRSFDRTPIEGLRFLICQQKPHGGYADHSRTDRRTDYFAASSTDDCRVTGTASSGHRSAGGPARRVGTCCRSRRQVGASHRPGRRAGQTQKCGADVAGSAECSGWIEDYAAADFLAVFDCALTDGLGASFFTVFVFSLAANSCLTWAVIATTSTL